MDRETYETFWRELTRAEEVPLRAFEEIKCFEGCLPIEVIARRGSTPRLRPDETGRPDRPADGRTAPCRRPAPAGGPEGILYNMVGFQTKLAWPEQRRIFRMIPGLENAEFVRYGSVHRNTFLNAPTLLTANLQLRSLLRLFFAGQITGVEGVCGIHGHGSAGRSERFPLPVRPGDDPAAARNGPGARSSATSATPTGNPFSR